MTTGTIERRNVIVLAVGVAAVLILRFGVMADHSTPAVAAPVDSIPLAEKRLDHLRAMAATVPGKEAAAHRAAADLAVREKGMIHADTAAQAQAQLLEIIRHAGKDEGIDVRGAEEMKVLPLADDYGEVVVAVSFTCAIEQFVNFMADLANRPELLATSDIRIAVSNPKDKTVSVRLGLSGVVPRKLVPAKKGPAVL
ncbi:MAG TPA: type II secretion system protein GspM [Bryobacteraceae bacterium]|nr:type II secretion system protein GspM [Bryobacteraceae bacterium]